MGRRVDVVRETSFRQSYHALTDPVALHSSLCPTRRAIRSIPIPARRSSRTRLVTAHAATCPAFAGEGSTHPCPRHPRSAPTPPYHGRASRPVCRFSALCRVAASASEFDFTRSRQEVRQRCRNKGVDSAGRKELANWSGGVQAGVSVRSARAQLLRRRGAARLTLRGLRPPGPCAGSYGSAVGIEGATAAVHFSLFGPWPNKAISPKPLKRLARPKGFEPLTPRFVV